MFADIILKLALPKEAVLDIAQRGFELLMAVVKRADSTTRNNAKGRATLPGGVAHKLDDE